MTGPADRRSGGRARVPVVVGGYVALWAAINWFLPFSVVSHWAALPVALGVQMAVGALIGRARAVLLAVPYGLVLWVIYVPLACEKLGLEIPSLEGPGWEGVCVRFVSWWSASWSSVIWEVPLAAAALLTGVLVRTLVLNRQ